MAHQTNKKTKGAPPTTLAAEELIRVSRFYREMAAETFPSRVAGSDASADLEHLEKVLMEQSSPAAAEEAFKQMRRCLTLLDSSITPFLLRVHIERRVPIAVETVRALLRYFLTKPPFEDADRDKLDYLATLLFSTETDRPLQPSAGPDHIGAGAPGDEAWLSLFAGLRWHALAAEQEDRLTQLAALIPRIEQYTDFEELVNSKVVHQARSIKKSLSSYLAHPEVVKQMVQFNLVFRKRFEELFRAETDRMRLVTRQNIQDAVRLKVFFAGQAGMETPESPATPGQPAPATAAVSPAQEGPVGKLKERPELEKYQRKFTRPLEEMQLKSLTTRIREYFAEVRMPVEAAMLVPLAHASFAVSPWEVEAFMPQLEATQATRALYEAIQQAVVIRGRLEEELTLYREKRETRYLWKPHFDSLGYAVASAASLLVQLQKTLANSASNGQVPQRSKLARSASDLIQTLEEVDRSL